TRASEPHKRLAHMLFTVIYGHPVWGLIRAKDLRRTRGMVGCIYNDFVVLSELAMLGQFWEIPETLMRLRKHAGNAVNVNPGSRALLSWIDPTLAKKKKWLAWPPMQQLNLEYLKAVYHVPMSASEKFLC